MRVLLRNTKTGFYLQSPGEWTERPEEALDLETWRQATNLAFEMGFEDLELWCDNMPSAASPSPQGG
jgi:hypothetical protein